MRAEERVGIGLTIDLPQQSMEKDSARFRHCAGTHGDLAVRRMHPESNGAS